MWVLEFADSVVIAENANMNNIVRHEQPPEPPATKCRKRIAAEL